MQNNIQIYERRYNNIFDILSEIGGVVQFLFYIFFWVNYIYNKYVIASDTNFLFFAVKDNQIKDKDDKKRKSKVIINNNENNNIKIHNFNNFNINYDSNNNIKHTPLLKLKKSIKKYSSLKNVDKEMKTKLNINNINQESKSNINNSDNNNFDNIIIKKKNENTNENNFNYFNNVNLIKTLNKNFFRLNQKNISKIDINSSSLDLKHNKNLIFKKELFSLENKNNKKKIVGSSSHKTFNYAINEEEFYNKIFLSKNSLAKIDHKTIRLRQFNKIEKIKTVNNFSFFIFLKYLCFEKKGKTGFIINFRKHLLSEEHLFKSHIKTILLEKEFNSKNIHSTNVFECFNEL